jgi:hypothetical protein
MSIRLLLHFLFITRGTICKWREGKRREAGYGFGGFKLNSTPRFGATATRHFGTYDISLSFQFPPIIHHSSSSTIIQSLSIILWAFFTSSLSTNPEDSSFIGRYRPRPPKSERTNGYALDPPSTPCMPSPPRQVLSSYRIIKMRRGRRMGLNKLREGGLY